jgi:hypothetical protein
MTLWYLSALVICALAYFIAVDGLKLVFFHSYISGIYWQQMCALDTTASCCGYHIFPLQNRLSKRLVLIPYHRRFHWQVTCRERRSCRVIKKWNNRRNRGSVPGCFELEQTVSDVYVIFKMTEKKQYFSFRHSSWFSRINVEKVCGRRWSTVSFVCFLKEWSTNRHFCTSSLTYAARLAAENSREKA